MSKLTVHEESAVQRVLRIKDVTVSVLRRAMYHLKKKQGICTETKCNRIAEPGIRLCAKHAEYHKTWQNRRKNHVSEPV
jgi:hypothetical protein